MKKEKPNQMTVSIRIPKELHKKLKRKNIDVSKTARQALWKAVDGD